MAVDEYSRETSKSVELKDLYKNLRFKIILEEATENILDKNDWDDSYTVTVISYNICDPTQGTIIKEDTYEDYEKASGAFNSYVYQYKALIAAETRSIQDIRIYEDKIHYKQIEVHCCRTCQWAKPVVDDKGLYFDDTRRKMMYQCLNPNIRISQDEVKPFDERKISPPHHCDHDRTLPYWDLAPYVIEDGVCDDYKLRIRPELQRDLQTTEDFLYHTYGTEDGIRDAEVKYEINQQVEDKLSKVKIAAIFGNDEDNNQNGIPDSEEGLDTVIGGLGA